MRVDADWYVLAVPPERAAALMNPQIVAADSMLGRIDRIEPTWLGGIGIYFTKPMPELHKIQICVGQPWSMAMAGYTELWGGDFASTYGDGSVKDYVSIDIPDWDVPGVLFGKPARDLRRDELFSEVLAQLRRELPDGDRILADDVIHSWHPAAALTVTDDAPARNDEPLFVNTPGSWHDQPEATTAIPNLFLAGAYVRTDAGLGVDSMDSAAESGRRAANGVLTAAGSDQPRAHVPEFSVPACLKPLMAIDDFLYKRGRRNFFDVLASRRKHRGPRDQTPTVRRVPDLHESAPAAPAQQNIA
jgi:hypothetical protein